jgi:AcrR family transcriptional regulator
LSSTSERLAASLRERKKAKTRAAIQQHTLRLFKEQGYEATTVSQIAEAAEISESTFFRYFPTKEDLVIQDEYDAALIEAFKAQPADLGPVEAMRGALRAVFKDLSPEELSNIRERTQLLLTVPELQEAFAGNLVQTVDKFSELVAARVGRSPDDLQVTALVGAMVGISLSVSLLAFRKASANYMELIDEALSQLETGFRF